VQEASCENRLQHRMFRFAEAVCDRMEHNKNPANLPSVSVFETSIIYTDILRVRCFRESHSRSERTTPCFHLGQHVRVMFSLGSEHTRPCVLFGQRLRGHLFIRDKTHADLIRCKSARARPVWRFCVWLDSACRIDANLLLLVQEHTTQGHGL